MLQYASFLRFKRLIKMEEANVGDPLTPNEIFFRLFPPPSLVLSSFPWEGRFQTQEQQEVLTEVILLALLANL